MSIKPGSLLIAQPFMLDPNFKRAVLCICEHDEEEGTVGFVLNRKIKGKITDVVEDFPEFNASVFLGGPVGTDSLHYMHNVGDLLEGSQQIIPGLYWGGDFEKLKFLIEQELVNVSNIKFFIGYSGWSIGQLSEELESGSWIQSQMHPNYAFKSKHFNLWNEALNNKGKNFKVIAQMPDSIQLN